MTQPYVPTPAGVPSPLYHLYNSQAQVVRLQPTFLDTGAMGVSWAPISDLVDPYLAIPGQLRCRLDLSFIRPGKDAPAPRVAGRAPDRVGLLFCDAAYDTSGRLFIKAGDRLTMLAGPIAGTFQFQQVPEPAQDMIGGHHLECQVVEVAQALEPTGLRPFPGVQP